MQLKNVRKISPTMNLEQLFQFWAWVLLTWSIYRYFFHLPEWADELVFKPLVFVLPVIWFVTRKEKRGMESLGFTGKNIFPVIYTGMIFGFVFALEGVIVNWLKHGELVINPILAFRQYGMLGLLGLSAATAVWEETLNRGFLFNRMWETTRNVFYSAFVSSILFVLLHVPILVTSLKLDGGVLALFFLTNFLLGMINCFLYARNKSIIAPILVHIFWNMTVALYL